MNRSNPQKNVETARSKKKRSNGTLFFILAFVVIAIQSLVFRNQPAIEWTLDYSAGIQRSEQTGKPALVAFHRQQRHFSAQMERGTWRRPNVIQFVHDNFIPILVNIDAQPEIAAEYDADYDSSYFIRMPDGRISPQLTHGNRPPGEFIARIREGLQQMQHD